MKIDLVIATYNRADQLRQTLKNVLDYCKGLNKIYVVNNNSTDNTEALLNEFEGEKLIVIHNEKNLGAAEGKNVGLRRSDADIIIIIDDDAEFFSDDPVGCVRRLFREDEQLGLIQFKIVNYQTKKILKHEFPGDDPEGRGNDNFEIGYFIGAGHAIRKKMLEEIGYYPDDFGLYAHEEIDLSYRAASNGYVMRYTPAIAVYHKKDAGGRLPPDKVLFNMFYNRLVMTRKYLPFPYSVVNNFLWFMKTTIDARSPALAFAAYRQYLCRKSSIHQKLLSSEAIKYMHRNHGRLFR